MSNIDLNLIGIFLLLLVSITIFIMSFAKPKQKADITSRLDKIKKEYDSQKLSNIKSGKDAIKLEFEEFTKRISPIASKTLNKRLEEVYRKKLDQAGKYDVSVIKFVSIRLISAILFPLVFIIFNILFFDLDFITSLTMFSIVAIIGYFYPLVKLNTMIEERKKEIFKSLPDTLDLLTVCLEAGMGINEALVKVVDKSRPSALRDEISRTLQEIQIGNPRLQALKDLAKRIELKELTSVIIAIIQAEKMGNSLSRTLKIQSEIIREIRWQKAQEQAQKAPVKIIIPVALFIFPTIFMVIFGPLVINYLVGN
ncbi:MAG: type II secretion system protein [Candidatus Sericytochromatia bacterium]|nr:MAG: type II secretion system protein [Candidatus Sericytochromatia bacterium]